MKALYTFFAIIITKKNKDYPFNWCNIRDKYCV